MKNILRTLAAGMILTLPILSSCDKKLDIDPVTNVAAERALNTSADVQAALVGGYEILGNRYLYGGGLQYYSDLLGDNGEVQWSGTYSQPREIFQKAILTNNTFVANTWTQAYQAINIANTVLANMDKVNEAQKKAVEGGAKFIRGTLYFELARYYGKAWNDGSPATNLAVPLVLTPTDPTNPDASIAAAGNLTRNTVAEVYAQAIKDLTEAETLLPASNGFFATTASASGMLSRVYLQQNKYKDAATEADKVISSGRYSLMSTYAEEFASKTNTQEDIIATQVTNQAGVNDLNTFYSSFGRGGDIVILDKHLDLYEKGDDRLNSFDYDSYLTTKFDNQYGNVHVMRLAEMYLTRAEGNFRAGTTIGAAPLRDINTVRARVNLDALTTLTLGDILNERHLELAFEGFLLHDIKRMALSVGSLPYTSPKLILPIPQRERDVNANLVQNEGY